MNPRITLAALAVASLFSTPVHAATPDDEGLIVVTATRQPTRHSELLTETSVIDREEISRAAPLATLGDLLARENGVETVTTGGPGAATNVFIRGASGSHTLLLVDGQRIGSATLGEPSISRIPLDQIERVEILRGPASGLYGSDAIGGVIQVFTRPATSEGTTLSASASVGSFNTREASAAVATQQGAVNASLRVGALKTDGFNANSNPDSSAYFADKDGYKNVNASGSLGYRFTPEHELSATVFYSSGENQYDDAYFTFAPFTSHPDFDFRTRQKVGSATVASVNKLTGYWTSTLRLGESYDESVNFDRPDHFSLFKTTQRQATWQNDFRLPVGKLLLAAERLEQKIDATSTFELTERNIDSALAGWTGNFGPHRLQANLRHDQNSQFGNKTTGNLGYGYQLSDAWRVRGSAGTAFNAPTFNDLYFPDDPAFGGGNPNLRPETAKSAELGVNRDTATGSLAATLYRNEISNLIEWQPDDPADPFGAWHPVNVGEVRLEGLSLSGKQRYGSLAVRATVDFLDSEDLATGKQLVLRAKRHASFGVDQQWDKTLLGAEVQAVGRRYNDAANNVKLAGYAVLNLLAEHRLGAGLTLFGKRNNALDRDYVVRTDFATAGRSLFVGLRYASR